MIRVRFYNKPDDTWVLLNENCIKIHAYENFKIDSGQIYYMSLGNMHYEFENSVGIPFIPKGLNKLSLYYPEGTNKWEDKKSAVIALKNNTNATQFINAGDFVCNVKLMSIQYFNLMRKHNNSDRGLMSSPVKIELVYDKINE